MTPTYPAAPAYPAYPAAVAITGSGWHSPLARGGRTPLARPVTTIGRMEDNDIVIADPLASRHHAVIRWTPGGYEIEDLGSVNGTTLQGQRVQGRAPLAPSQTVQIGATNITLQALRPEELAAFAPARTGAIARVAGPAAQGTPTNGDATVRGLAPAPRTGNPIAPGGLALAPGAVAGAPPYAYPGPYAAPAGNPVIRQVRSFLRKRWWKFFLIGLAAYIVSLVVLLATGIVNLIPLVLLIASALAPVTFVIYCWEQSAFADMPAATVAITFLNGAVLGLILAAILEPLLLNGLGLAAIPLVGALVIGFCEETAKVIPVLWFLRDRRIRSELDGVILGAASGMGFAALETAGYGFQSFIAGYTQVLAPALSQHTAGPATIGAAFTSGIIGMNIELVLRMALAIFGHGVWTAIVCAAIWRYRQRSVFRQLGGIITAYLIAVILHAAWDSAPQGQGIPFPITLSWYLIVGMTGILILRFLIWESLERAKLGPSAPAPQPLLLAMAVAFGGFFTPWRRRPQPQPAYAFVAPAGQPAAANPPQGAYPSPNTPGMGQLPALGRVAQPQAAAQPAAQPSRYCRACGSPNPSSAALCGRCGAALG